MKKGKLLKIAFLIALIIWTVMLIKQQTSLTQYKKEIDVLSSKIDVAEDELNQNERYKFIDHLRNLDWHSI